MRQSVSVMGEGYPCLGLPANMDHMSRMLTRGRAAMTLAWNGVAFGPISHKGAS